MPLDPGTAAMLAELERLGRPGPADSDVPGARAGLRAFAGVGRTDPAALPPVASVVDGEVGGVRTRTYRPVGLEPGTPAPTVVFLHGGGFVVGDLDTHDVPCRLLAGDLGAVVVSVDYGLAPEHPFPEGLEDCWRALRAVADGVDDLGGDPARLVVAGDSAGGNLAAVCALRARDEGVPLAAQLLLYPVVDPAGDHPSREENAEGYFLTARDMTWFTGHYLGVDPTTEEGARTAAAVARDVRVSPLHADLAGVAPAVVVTAEYDPLRDEGVAYARALEAAGVRVSHRTVPRLVHGFYGTPLPAALRATHEAHAALAELLR
ncbi:alpha/beta hydrolase [uncultured Pseudokineococcus sp.]|uniref:alpha/beta hydrolase n=1 Tax=uncultured Pseudokineococcus sp. TaxID=1642928 RepID=UPI00260CCB76|nr:alpha/beta hydrolase [uncultured Pseudokineococcus sp.]